MNSILTFNNKNVAIVYTRTALEYDMDMFISSLRMAGRRETTLRTYREALKSVFRTLEADYGGVVDPRTVSAQDFGYLRATMSVCDSSKKLYLVVLGRFVDFLTGHNPRQEADLLWNEDDKRRLFITIDDFKVMMYRGTPLERLILSLGAYMGLRRSEMAGIRLKDIADGHITVRGKGHGPDGKVARLFIPLPVQKCIDTWMVERERIVLSSGSVDDHLILSQGRNLGKGVTGNRIGDMVKSFGKKCGVDLTAHSLRRLYCTTLWSAGVDANTVRLMMRHASINTTMQCYIQPRPEGFFGARKVLIEMLG